MLHDEVASNIHKLEIVTNVFFLRYIVVSLVTGWVQSALETELQA